MLSDRMAITALLLPVALWVIWLGGWVYLLALLFILLVAALEYAHLFRAAGQRPALPLIVGGTLLLLAARQFPVLNPHNVLLALTLIAALAWHLVDYERGAPASGTDFVATVGGIFYLGWLGGYFISLRALPPDGLWWLMAALTSVWLSDSGAYSLGRAFGRHRMAPRLSPKKTWEGYVGGVLTGAAGSALFSLFWRVGAGPDSLLTWQNAALLGALIGVLGHVGDLGVSMLKRQVGVKDTGTLLAGHGGALDRIDSWLVAVPIGYFFVLAQRALHG